MNKVETHDFVNKKIIIFILFCSSTIIGHAQFDGMFTQYMYVPNYLNAASLGSQDMSKALLAQRIQWVGISDAPKTTFASVNMPFKLFGVKQAAGLTLLSDQFGLFTNQKVSLQYAYKHDLGFATLSGGLDLAALNLTIDGDTAHIPASDYHTTDSGDPVIPTSKKSGTSFDIGISAYLNSKTWYAGLGISHLNAPTIEIGDKTDFKISPLYHIVGGYTFSLNNKDWHLTPSILLVSDITSNQIYATMSAEYKQHYWGGLTYSYQNALSIMLGMHITREISLGYNYDLPISEFINESSGSHEVFLSYDFNLGFSHKSKKHKSVRIL